MRGGTRGCRSGQGAPQGHPYSRPAAPGTFAHAPTAGPQVSLQQEIFQNSNASTESDSSPRYHWSRKPKSNSYKNTLKLM